MPSPGVTTPRNRTLESARRGASLAWFPVPSNVCGNFGLDVACESGRRVEEKGLPGLWCSPPRWRTVLRPGRGEYGTGGGGRTSENARRAVEGKCGLPAGSLCGTLGSCSRFPHTVFRKARVSVHATRSTPPPRDSFALHGCFTCSPSAARHPPLGGGALRAPMPGKTANDRGIGQHPVRGHGGAGLLEEGKEGALDGVGGQGGILSLPVGGVHVASPLFVVGWFMVFSRPRWWKEGRSGPQKSALPIHRHWRP